MDGLTFQMFMAAANKAPTGLVIGQSLEGGYFAGYISHTANGVATHALIVAPRASGASGTGYPLTTSYQWKTSLTTTTNASSTFDGAANTAAMVTAGIASHPAANFCVDLDIGGYSDWYLPARYELDIAYFNLKPTTASNTLGYGENSYSVPKRTTSTAASRTSVAAFQSDGLEAFVASSHWSSSQSGSERAARLDFSSGAVSLSTSTSNKTLTYRVRAFRRIAL